jgi:hypothetical protein
MSSRTSFSMTSGVGSPHRWDDIPMHNAANSSSVSLKTSSARRRGK